MPKSDLGFRRKVENINVYTFSSSLEIFKSNSKLLSHLVQEIERLDINLSKHSLEFQIMPENTVMIVANK